ncbi:alpha/beta hydrolase [Paraburkholderia sp. Ac-20347]|uniref:alpha/beta hydrolase n=1 Tax=Paraburkholderia sp. Ac-20347 TaxID=2703892 RepID=UPI00197DCE9F|nr:alpha/beta hydrolase [Paraburkholderia sp. Ac-20347]MBN3807621.1 alpha/beta hydrolase [Paraburkholderia sp. Ac-20347]
MQAFIRTAAAFRSASDDWPSRRAAFARQCAHFTRPAERTLQVTDQRIGGVMTRCYRPAGSAPSAGWPVLMYLHGGGWTAGSHTTHDWFAHALLERADLAIVAVDYRLAPEASFPAPLNDCLSVWRGLGDAGLPLDLARVAVAGDSAGGTLAAALCIALRDHGRAQPKAQALLYAVLTADDTGASMREFAQAPTLSAAGLTESLRLYLPEAGDWRHPHAMPLAGGDLSRLAPALVLVAMNDVLRDQGIDYAARLQVAGVDTELWRGEGLVHAALRVPELAEVAAAYNRLAAFLLEQDTAERR